MCQRAFCLLTCATPLPWLTGSSIEWVSTSSLFLPHIQAYAALKSLLGPPAEGEGERVKRERDGGRERVMNREKVIERESAKERERVMNREKFTERSQAWKSHHRWRLSVKITRWTHCSSSASTVLFYVVPCGSQQTSLMSPQCCTAMHFSRTWCLQQTNRNIRAAVILFIYFGRLHAFIWQIYVSVESSELVRRVRA